MQCHHMACYDTRISKYWHKKNRRPHNTLAIFECRFQIVRNTMYAAIKRFENILHAATCSGAYNKKTCCSRAFFIISN